MTQRLELIEATLGRCPMFAKLPEEDRKKIADISRLRKALPKELLFTEGEKADRFYVVATGDVKIFKLSRDGREQVLHHLHPCQTFAEAAVFLATGYPASAMTLRQATLLEIPGVRFHELMRRDPELAIRVMGSLSHWLRRLVDQVEDLSFSQVPVRLARQIIRFSEASQVPLQSGSTIHIPMTKTELAGLLGTVSETLSRAFHRLTENGILEVRGRRITVLNADGLRKMTER